MGPREVARPDDKLRGKSEIHNHRSVNMDPGLLAALGPGMTFRVTSET